MNKIMSGLAAIALGLYSGCMPVQKKEAPQPVKQEPVQMSDAYLTTVRAQHIKMGEDKKYDRLEALAAINQYQTLKTNMPDTSAAKEVQDLYAKTLGEYEKTINDAFAAADIYAYVGIVTDKASGNRRGNYGGSKPLYVGKGKDVADVFDTTQKIELLSKARPVWVPYNMKGDVISEDEVYATSIGVSRGKFAEIFGKRTSFGKKDDSHARYLDDAGWGRLTNGSTETDGEVRDEHLRFNAVYAGHKAE